MINNGRQLHLQHGPIDLVIEASGDNVAAAYRAALVRFETVLEELVEELPILKSRTNTQTSVVSGSVAKRMVLAAGLFQQRFTTPMIAVAGSVADEILQTMCQATELKKAYVNNGGDIALHLAPKQSYTAGIVSDPRRGDMPATVTLTASDGIGGIATSGRHGRSLSLGIADAVTVMAPNAAIADAAATLIANEVTLPDSPSVVRVAANQIDPDSDLHDAAVTTDVGRLQKAEVCLALDRGLQFASKLQRCKRINAAYLTLQGESRTLCGSMVTPSRLPADSGAQQNNEQRLIAHA